MRLKAEQESRRENLAVNGVDAIEAPNLITKEAFSDCEVHAEFFDCERLERRNQIPRGL